MSFKIDENTYYSVEELLAMVLRYAVNLADTYAKGTAKDFVFSVPPYFGQAKRKGLMQAAELAGMNVLSLVNEHSGATLQYGMQVQHAKGTAKDFDFSVPPYFGQAKRKGLMRAAELAGMNVLSLVNEHSGATLQYGIDKDFSNESSYVVFYDIGASTTYAALIYFSAYNAKEYSKTVSVNQFQVKDVRWNVELGARIWNYG